MAKIINFDNELKDITDDMNFMLIDDCMEYTNVTDSSEISDNESNDMNLDSDSNSNNNGRASYREHMEYSLFFNKNWETVKNNNPTLSNKEIYNKIIDLWNNK